MYTDLEKKEIDTLQALPGFRHYFKGTPKKIKINDKFFANIHLSREVGGLPDLQGSESARSMGYTVYIIENFLIHNKSKALWHKELHKMVLDLKNASQYEGILWQNEQSERGLYNTLQKTPHIFFRVALSNHGVLVEADKKSDNLYIIRVMNAGYGLNYHEESEDKGKSKTVAEFIFDKDGFKNFLKKIKKSGNVNFHSFYESLIIHSKSDIYPAEESKLMVSGMCSWKMMIAFLKYRLSNHKVYLRIKQEIYTQSLIDYYLLFMQDKNALRARHLELAMNNYARFLTEKIKDKKLDSVRSGIQLCQYIQRKLSKKEWVEPIPTIKFLLDTIEEKSSLAIDESKISITKIAASIILERDSDKVAVVEKLENIETLKDACRNIDCFLETVRRRYPHGTINADDNADDPDLDQFKEYARNFILKMPSILDVDFNKEDILVYQKKLRDLQLVCRSLWGYKVSDDCQISIIESAKLFLEMVFSYEKYFGEYTKDYLPSFVVDKAGRYLRKLNSSFFNCQNPLSRKYWASCMGALERLALDIPSSIGFLQNNGALKKSYFETKEFLLKKKYNLNKEDLIILANKKLCDFLVTKKDGVDSPSVENPIDCYELAKFFGFPKNAVVKFNKINKERDGFFLDSKASFINNIYDLAIVYSDKFFPEFESDERVLDSIMVFLHDVTGDGLLTSCFQREADEKNLFLCPDDYDRVVDFCKVHKKIFDKDTCSKCDEFERVYDSESCRYSYLNPWVKVSKVITYDNPNIKDVFKIKKNTKITSSEQFCGNTPDKNIFDDVNYKVALLLSNQDLSIQEKLNISGWLSAFATHEVQLESVLQYHMQNFETLNDDSGLLCRNNLYSILLRPNSVGLLLENNKNNIDFFKTFIESYKKFISFDDDRTDLENICSFITVLICYLVREKDLKGQNVGFYSGELFEQAIANPLGKLLHTYFQVKNNYCQQDYCKLFSDYCQSICILSKSSCKHSDIEKYFLTALQYEMTNVFAKIMKMDNINDCCVMMSAWVSKKEDFLGFQIKEIGFKTKKSIPDTRFLILSGVDQNRSDRVLVLDLLTGTMADAMCDEAKIPKEIMDLFPCELKGSKNVSLKDNRYYFTTALSEHCFISVSPIKLYKKIGPDFGWHVRNDFSDINKKNNIFNFMKNKKYEFWSPAEDGSSCNVVHIINSETKKEEYCYDDGFYYKVEADLRFKLVTSKKMEKFESSFMTEVSNDPRKSFISFPRYNLSFNWKDNEYLWSVNQDYKLIALGKTELGEGFEQFLAISSISDSKKRKVLIPCQSYIHVPETNKIILDTYGAVKSSCLRENKTERNFKKIGNSIYHSLGSENYVVLEVDGNGMLSAESTSDKLYLLYLFLSNSDYNRAIQVFREIEAAGFYGIDAVSKNNLIKIICEDIPVEVPGVKDDDRCNFVIKNGKKTAIQLKIFIGLLKTHLGSESDVVFSIFDLLQKKEFSLDSMVENYILHYSNIPVELYLSEEESSTLFNFMRACNISVQKYVRQKPFKGLLENTSLKQNLEAPILWDHTPKEDNILSGTSYDREVFEEELKAIKEPFLTELQQLSGADSLEEKMAVDDRYGQVILEKDKEFLEQSRNFDLFNEVNKKIQIDTEKIQKTKEKLLLLCHKNVLTKNKDEMEFISKKLSARIRPFSFRELIQLFMNHDSALYREKLGPLTDAELKEIDLEMADILRLLTKRQYYKRLKKELDASSKDLEKIADILNERRSYDLSDPYARYFLSFEYLSGFLIRPAQMKMLKFATTKDILGEEKKSVFQLIMGGGKSKVLMPLIAFLKAKPGRLAMVVVPDSLFETNVYDLSKISENIFGQSAFPLRFNRSDAGDIKKLETLRNRLKEISSNKNSVDHKEYVIATKKTIQSIELSYVALLTSKIENSESGKETARKIHLLEDVLDVFQNNTDVFVDEIDTSLNCFDELNYTLENIKSSPEYLINLQTHFFEFLCSEKSVDGRTWYDILITPNLTLNQDFIKDVFYNIIQEMSEKDCFLKTALESFNGNQKQEIILYLVGKSERVPDFLNSFEGDDVKKVIGFCKAQFSKILPLILSKEENIHYGFSANKHLHPADSLVSIPYAGNNSPKKSSRFSNLYETFGYTTLLHLKHGVPRVVFDQYIDDFITFYKKSETNQKRALCQKLREDLFFSGEIDIKFIINKNKEYMDFLWNSIKCDKKAILYFLKENILSDIKLYPFMINSSSSDFSSMLGLVGGASGTIDNPGILDPDIDFDKELSLGTDGRTISILKSDKIGSEILVSEQARDVHESISSRAYLDNLKKQVSDFNFYQSIIDVGAHFNGVSNLEVARGIAEFYNDGSNNSNFKYVLYFNEKNILTGLSLKTGLSTEIGSSDAKVIKEKIKCDPDEYFVYFDQIHTIGTDITMKKGKEAAKAFVSFDPKTTQTTLLQGVMRERDLANSQGLSFVGNKCLFDYLDGKNLLHSKSSILGVARYNLIEKIRDGSFRSANQKIKAIYRRATLNLIRKTKDIKEKQKILKDAGSCIFNSMDLDPDRSYLKNYEDKSTELLLNNIVEYYNDSVGYLFENDGISRKKLMDAANGVITHCVEYCRLKTISVDDKICFQEQAEVEIEAETELEAESEAELETSLEMESELELVKWNFEKTKYNYRHYDLNFIDSIFNMKDISDLDQSMSVSDELKSLMGEANQIGNPDNLFYSKNLLSTTGDAECFFQNPVIKPCFHALWIESVGPHNKQRSIILLSNRDAAEARFLINKLRKTNEKYNFSLHTMSGHSADQHADSIKVDDDWDMRMDQARFYAGYLNEDNQWLKQDTKNKLDFYKKYILPYHVNTKDVLKKLYFEELKKQKISSLSVYKEKFEKKSIPPWESMSCDLEVEDCSTDSSSVLDEEAVEFSAKKYAVDRYHHIVLKSYMRRLFSSIFIIQLIAGMCGYIWLKIKKYFLEKTIEKEKLKEKVSDLEELSYQVDNLDSNIELGPRFYQKALKEYKNLKARYYQAQASSCRDKESRQPEDGVTPETKEEILERVPVPFSWGQAECVPSLPQPVNEKIRPIPVM